MKADELEWTLDGMIADAMLSLMECPLEKVHLWVNYIDCLEKLKKASHSSNNVFLFCSDQLAVAHRELFEK